MKTDTWSVANTKLVTIIKDIFQGKSDVGQDNTACYQEFGAF